MIGPISLTALPLSRQPLRSRPVTRFPTRLVSTEQAPQSSHGAPKQVSPHVGFYKTFGRPIAKVFLMATFTYQLTYWLWVKLEKDEIRSERQSEIDALETKLQGLVPKKKEP